MQERFAFEHFGKLANNAFEYLLYGAGVHNASGGFVESDRRDVAYGRLNPVWYPVGEVRVIFIPVRTEMYNV